MARYAISMQSKSIPLANATGAHTAIEALEVIDRHSASSTNFKIIDLHDGTEITIEELVRRAKEEQSRPLA